MEGSVGEEKLLVRKVFVTGAVRFPNHADKIRMRGIHETIAEACKKKGIEAFVPLLMEEEEQHRRELSASDLVIVEGTFKEPRLDVQIGTAKDMQKPILYVYEESSLESRLRRQAEDFKWKIEYTRYPVLSRLLLAWFDEYATCPATPS